MDHSNEILENVGHFKPSLNMQENAKFNSPSIFEEPMEYKEKTTGRTICRKQIKNAKRMDEGKTENR